MNQSYKVYWHPNCGTCKKAKKWLEDQNIEHTLIDLRDKAPSKKSIQTMMDKNYADNPKRLFNTSGKSYREGGFKEKLAEMTSKDMVDELAQDGLLIKRPFVLTESGQGVVGFKEPEWRELFDA